MESSPAFFRRIEWWCGVRSAPWPHRMQDSDACLLRVGMRCAANDLAREASQNLISYYSTVTDAAHIGRTVPEHARIARRHTQGPRSDADGHPERVRSARTSLPWLHLLTRSSSDDETLEPVDFLPSECSLRARTMQALPLTLCFSSQLRSAATRSTSTSSSTQPAVVDPDM
jgi:hypothetical protein